MAVVKVDEQTRERLARLAEEEQETFGHLIVRALDAFEEARFWRQAEAVALARQANLEMRAADLREQQEWDGTLADGFADDVPYPLRDDDADAK